MSQDEKSPASTVREAPTTTSGILRNVGPGMILAGSIVGSGELIATTQTGAEAHFDFLWLIIIGCIIKVFAQIELGRYAITNGKTTLAALNEVPGPRLSVPVGKRRANANWILLYWFLMFVAILGQQGGIVGGVGQAMAISVPLTDQGKAYNEHVAHKVKLDVKKAEVVNAANHEKQAIEAAIAELKAELDRAGEVPEAKDDVYWSLILTLAAIFLLVWGNFNFIQRFSVFLVISFTFITIANLLALQSYDRWAVTAEEFRRGLSFGFPEAKEGARNPLVTALSTFGIIGVGAAELLAYPYWCLEKGYGKYVGKRDDSDAWTHRAKGWMKVMHWDAWGAMVVYTFCTIAFYLLGAAVLGRSNLIPEKSEMIQTLSAMYQPVFGDFAQNLFLFGAFAVLFSTFYVAIAAQGRLAVDVVKVSGVADLDEPARQRGLKWMGVILPILSVLCYVFFPNPVVLVLISGTMQAIMLPMIGFAVLYFRYKKSDKRLQPSTTWDVFLWLSFAGFLVVGIYQTYAKLFQ